MFCLSFKRIKFIIILSTMISCSTIQTVPPPKKNVILIVSSALSTKHLSLYNKKTQLNKNIEIFFENGLIFDAHYTNSKWPFQSLVSINTGKSVAEHSILLNRYHNEILYNKKFNTEVIQDKIINEYFKDANYSTFFMGGKPHRAFFSKEIGFGKGVDKFVDKTLDSEKDIEVIIDFIENSESPFFLNLNSVIMHFPNFFLTKENIKKETTYKGKLPKNYEEFEFLLNVCFNNKNEKLCPVNFEHFSKEFRQKSSMSTNEYNLISYLMHKHSQEDLSFFKETYDQSVEYFDGLLGKLFDYLVKENLDKNTIVILTSDVGQVVTEGSRFISNKDEFFFGYSTSNNEVLKVPLLVFTPERKISQEAIKVVSELTQSQDLLPMILNSVGIENNFEKKSDLSFYKNLTAKLNNIYGLSYRPHKGLESYLITPNLIFSKEGNRSVFYERIDKSLSLKNNRDAYHLYFKQLEDYLENLPNNFLLKVEEYNQSYLKGLNTK